MAALYPRCAFEGVLTLIHWNSSKFDFCHLLDVEYVMEYVTWARPESEFCHCLRPPESLHPWDLDESSPPVALRPETEPILRERERIGPAHGIVFEAMVEELKGFPSFAGSLNELERISWADADG